jgi:hypothetical protein
MAHALSVFYGPTRRATQADLTPTADTNRGELRRTAAGRQACRLVSDLA